MNIIRGKEVNEHILLEIDSLNKELNGVIPKLAIVRVGNNEDDIAYESSIIKRFEKLSLGIQSIVVDNDINQKDFNQTIVDLNNDDNVHGILVFKPLPKTLDEDILAQIIDPIKDIDGISYTNIARLFSQDGRGFVPCTPQAVMEIINYLNIDLKGKNVTIVGAGMAAGRPLSILMLNQQATITICRSLIKDLVQECKKADVVVVAAGKPKLISKEHIKFGATVIDVGINLDENNKLVGDVDFEHVAPLCKHITPVPGGVGAITTTILIKQLYQAAIMQQKTV